MITKVLANRLRLVMTKLTDPYQSSFVAGRSTTDNVIVAQELIYSLLKRKNRKSSFVFKVDLEKVYDRID